MNQMAQQLNFKNKNVWLFYCLILHFHQVVSIKVSIAKKLELKNLLFRPTNYEKSNSGQQIMKINDLGQQITIKNGRNYNIYEINRRCTVGSAPKLIWYEITKQYKNTGTLLYTVICCSMVIEEESETKRWDPILSGAGGVYHNT